MNRAAPLKPGAGNESRTRDLNLGKVALYQLSYSRVEEDVIIGKFCPGANLLCQFLLILGRVTGLPALSSSHPWPEPLD